MSNKEKFKKLVDLTCELEKLGAEVFLHYRGHLKLIEIRVFLNGWILNEKPDYYSICHFDDEKLNLNCENIDNSIIFLTGLLNLKKENFNFQNK